MNTTISRKIEWDMGHRLQDHESLCFNPHGHRYKLEVVIEGQIRDRVGDPERGMIFDFSYVKQALAMVISKLDHAFMVERGDIFAGSLAQFARHVQQLTNRQVNIIEVDFPPTAEKIAEFLFTKLKGRIPGIIQVTVWETPSSKAMVSERSHIKETMP